MTCHAPIYELLHFGHEVAAVRMAAPDLSGLFADDDSFAFDDRVVRPGLLHGAAQGTCFPVKIGEADNPDQQNKGDQDDGKHDACGQNGQAEQCSDEFLKWNHDFPVGTAVGLMRRTNVALSGGEGTDC